MSSFSRWNRAGFLLAVLSLAGWARAVAVDATAYSNYSPGSAPSSYQTPSSALGAINPDTGGGQGSIDPFNPAYQPTDIAWVGGGGSLTLQLSSPLPSNGINLGVYSNVGYGDVSGNGSGQAGSPPSTLGQISRATVSVSPDGVNWATLNGGQPISFSNPTNWYTDSTITNGYEPAGSAHASQSKPFLGNINSFSGQTYSQMLSTLNNSAGGTWLDLRNTGFTNISYVKFNVASGDRMIVDAIGGLGAANAATLTNGSRVISEDVGTGANTSHIIVDFGPQSYDFAVHYNGSISGEQAMSILQSNSDFRYTVTNYGSYGDFLDTIDYGGYALGPYDPSTGDYWAYYTGDTNHLSYSNVGFSSYMLTNGSYEGWLWTNDGADNTPAFAVVTVPEPAIGLTMLAGVLMLRRRR